MSNPYSKLDEKRDPSKESAEIQNVKAQILERDKQIHNLQSELEKKKLNNKNRLTHTLQIGPNVNQLFTIIFKKIFLKMPKKN